MEKIKAVGRWVAQNPCGVAREMDDGAVRMTTGSATNTVTRTVNARTGMVAESKVKVEVLIEVESDGISTAIGREGGVGAM